MKIANKSDVGRLRTVNEDRAIVQADVNGLTLAIVADGMGGHQAGDIASQISIEVIQEKLQSIHPGMSIEEFKISIKEAIYEANQKVYEAAAQNKAYMGMGTTVVVAIVSEEVIVIGHIGDSRAYKLSEDTIEQLTEDHSLVAELVKSGQISPEEANDHPRRNVLTRALGTEQFVNVDTRHVYWKENEILLLCSDGLSSMVSREQMLEILRSDNELEWKVNRLVDCALEAGGDDNITVVLLENVQSQTETG